MRREREPGENPGLSRSGMQERPPSYSTGTQESAAGKRRPVGARFPCVPVSPKTCQPYRARRVRWFAASRNGQWPKAVHSWRVAAFGSVSPGGGHPLRTLKDLVMSTTATPFSATILGSPRIGPNRELKRAVEKYWAGRIDRAELESVAATLRRDTWKALVAAGLDSV